MARLIRVYILAAVILLSGCAGNTGLVPDSSGSEGPAVSATSPEGSQPEPARVTVAYGENIRTEKEAVQPLPFESDVPLSLEDTIKEYFNQHYLSYTSLQYIGLDYFLDLDVRSNQNLVVWTKALTERRRLLRENDLCYVDTAVRSYQIVFDRQPEEAFFSNNARGRAIAGGGDTAVYFHITGEPGEAYPPIMAVNAQHVMMLKQVDGHWKITMHYFPGAVRKFLFGAPDLPDENQMLDALKEEFAAAETGSPSQVPAGAVPYSADRAVSYAMEYTEKKNPAYYDIGDFTGNCANFVSQCLSAGVEDRHTSNWFGGGGGGSPAWETVSYLWDFLTGVGGIQGRVIPSPAQLQAGDVVVVKSRSNPRGNGGYNHALLLIDDETMKLAQNSPACFVYWSDLLDVEYGLFRPEYIG